MSEPSDRGATTAVAQNGVTVERHLERRGDGIVVTLELSADVRGPAVVDLVDEFPPELSVEQAGFNVDHEPDDGEVSLERVAVHHAIEDPTDTIVYAIRLSEAADDVAFDPPTIREVTFPAIPEPDVPAGEAATGDRQAPDRRPPEPEPSTGGDGLPEGLTLEDSAEGTADDPEGVASGAEASLDGLDRDDDGDADPIESALERAEASGAGLDAGTDDDDASGPATNGGSPAADSTAIGPIHGDADGADGGRSPGAEVPRSVGLRLDRLDARVEEFAADVEALEEIVERHGTTPESLEEIEADLAEADEGLAAVREAVESLESRHAADVADVRDDVGSLESRLEDARRDLESDVAGVRDDLDAVDGMRADVDEVAAEVDALGDRVDDWESVVDDLGETVDRVAGDVSSVSRNVETMCSEMETLQDDVDRLLRFREILADVFGGSVRRATAGGDSPFEEREYGSPTGRRRSRSDDRSREGGASSSPTGPSG